ncbi:MAG: hypothetical protein AB1502_08655 [Thermodesulfobacteriota bacterium]
METFTRTINALCEKETYRNDKDIWKGIATLLIYLYLCLMKQELVQRLKSTVAISHTLE